MDIHELKNIVGEVLDRTGPFVLSIDALKSGAAESISDDFLPDKKLRLSGASVVQPETADAITVRGTGLDLPFKSLAVEVVFYLEGGTAAFSLTATGNADWTLAKSFPPFAHTLAEQLRFATAPKLFLDTHARADGRPSGLSFDGMLDLNKLTVGLASLLGQPDLRLSGPIELKAKGSKFYGINLVALVSKSIDLGIAKVDELTFRVGSQLHSYTGKQKYYIKPFVELAAAIPFSSTKPKIPISARATTLGSGFRFQADLSSAIDVVIDELTSLTNGHGMDNVLPDGFQLSRFLKLNEFFFDFDPSAKKVTFIGMGVQSTQSWRVLHVAETNQNLEVQKIQLAFIVGDPFGAAYKSLTINGAFAIGNAGIIEAGMRYPGWVVHANLKEGKKLSLRDAVGVFKRSTEHVPIMDLEEFELVVSPQGFSLSLELDGELAIPNAPFGLERAFASIESSPPAFSFTGLLLVGGIDVMLIADYPGSDEGWHFKGSTGPGQKIPIGNLIEDLAQKFGDIKLPSAISSLVVQDLSVTFETKTKQFTFGCAGKFRFDDTDVDITVLLKVKQEEGVYSREFGGTLKAGGLNFDLHFVKSGASDCLVATYHPDTPDHQATLDVKQLVGSVSSAVAAYVPEGLKIKLKDVIFAYSKSSQEGAASKFVFGIDVGTGINLSNLPLVGQELPPDATVSVDNLQILFNSKALSATEVENFNRLIPERVSKLPVTTPAAPVAIDKGFSISAEMNFGGSKHVLRLPEPDSRSRLTSDVVVQGEIVGANAPTDNVKWFVLQKTFGPVFFDKVGVQYQASKLRFLLNAALSAAGLTLSLDGLSVSSSLSEIKPEFSLRGLGIDYKNDAVEIGGAFLRTEKAGKPDSYDGAAVIKTKQFALSALGSYTKTTPDGPPSLFIYAFLNYPLGGPAFFFVTGLAAGFGYNRKLIAPSIDNVAEFPLVKQADRRQVAPKGVLAALETLQQYVPPSVGDMFLAVGVRFTSFKLIESFALLTFEFGSHFTVNLLGLSTAVVPPEPGAVTPLAQVQIAWKATFDPEEGFLGIDARLTPNSYILSKDCHLSGGYAFYSWFSGDHAGDFVQTLGGYNTNFEKIMPAHYPKVPRLAFDWRISNSLTIQGKAYYALTGSALMAGGYLEVLFKEGELRAWLKVGADFFICWKPFHYDVRLYVNVGASYTFDINLLFTRVRVTISVDVGADLHLWGPDFSGTAHIDISVISFTVAFGAGASQKPKPLESWNLFQQSFLPEKNVCSISVGNGLVRKMGEGETERLIINPTQFSLLVNSAIPFKSAASTTGSKTELVPSGANKKFGVRPMAKSAQDFNSTLSITLKRGDVAADSDFSYDVIQKTVPKGLWDSDLTPERLKDTDLTPELSHESFLDDVPSGIEITPANGPLPGASATIKLDVFKYSEFNYEPPKDQAYVWEPASGFAPSPASDEKTRRKKIEAGVETNPDRAALLNELHVPVEVKVRGNIVANDFMSAPQLGKL